jgi:putative oxygen-independent coproporphyrinogen III oxidase
MLATPPTSLYVHIPWCVKKCPYCDFNSHERRGASEEAAYVDALIADLDADLAQFPWIAARRIDTVFFGGGTPSLFAPDAIARILDGARSRLRFADDCEITLETNPGTIEHGRFDGYRRAGVNRVSLGVQSFDEAALKRLGRIHGAEEARRAVHEARDAGIAAINLDLMYALPEQTLAQALHDVEQAIALAPEHLSHYQLTLEANTVFAAHPPPLPDDDSAWDMQEGCQALLAGAGYAQYEVSAYARAGHRCRHNLNYWRFGDYLGIGAGAHAKLTDVDRGHILRPWKVKHPRAYLEHAAGSARLGGVDTIAREALPFEFMLNTLRLDEGFVLAGFEAATGVPGSAISARLDDAVARGWLDADHGHYRPTALGSRFLNDLIERFLP